MLIDLREWNCTFILNESVNVKLINPFPHEQTKKKIPSFLLIRIALRQKFSLSICLYDSNLNRHSV